MEANSKLRKFGMRNFLFACVANCEDFSTQMIAIDPLPVDPWSMFWLSRSENQAKMYVPSRFVI